MHILLYESIPDINRSLFLKRLRRYLRSDGHEVSCLLDERVYFRLQGGQREFGIINCSGPMSHNLILANNSSTHVYCPTDEDLAEVSSENRKKFYSDVLHELVPDRIVVWNGMASHHEDFMAVVNEAGLRDKVYFMELGWLPQRDSFHCDPRGVNAASSIAHDDYSAPLSAEQSAALKAALVRHYESCLIRKLNNLILVPLQIESDSNITHFSPYKTNQEFITMLEEWIPAGYKVVIRPHPLSVLPVPTWKRSDFVLDRYQELYRTLGKARFVVGINSTVLVEALACGAGVMAFGRGVFSSLSGVHVTEEDFFEDVAGRVVSYERFLYELIFNKQVSMRSFRGVEKQLDLMPGQGNGSIAVSQRGRYPFSKLIKGEIRYCVGIIFKKLGIIK